MQRTYNNALIIVRGLGLLSVAIGIMWFVNIAAATVLVVVHLPEWLLNPIWGYTAQGLLSGPIWFIAGLVILAKSERLAAFDSKGATDDAA